MKRFEIMLKDGLVYAVFPIFNPNYQGNGIDEIIEAESYDDAVKKAEMKYGGWYQSPGSQNESTFKEEENARYSPEQVYGIKGLL